MILLFAVSARAAEAPGESTPTLRSDFISTATWRSAPNTAFTAGEDLSFVVKWGVLTGGNSTLSITGIETIGGRPAYHIVSKATSTGLVDTFFHVRDQNDSWLDAGSLTTVRYEKHISEGKYRIEESGAIDQSHHQYAMQSFRLDKNRYEAKQGTVTVNVLDVLGSLYYVRTLPMEVGASYTMDVFSGEKIYPLVVKVLKREKVRVPAGKFDCFRVQPLLREPGIFVSKGKKLEVWLTADERHLPVRMRSEVVIGHVSADLLTARQNSPSNP